MSSGGETSHVADLLQRIRGYGDREACFWAGHSSSYAELANTVDAWVERLGAEGISRGSIVGVLADYSPQSVALVLATMRIGAMLVPFSQATEKELDGLAELAGVRHLVRFNREDHPQFETRTAGTTPALIETFLERGHPGLVVFTSGSTGKPKGILHDCERVVKKFAEPRRAYRTLLFLLFDHFGGFNTLMAVLSYGGTMVMPSERTPREVARIVEAGRVELLPVTPTLLNLLLASGAAAEHDLSSVKLITYGTEVMPEATLRAIAKVAPQARLQQTYGLSELGVLRSKSRDSESLWVKVGGQGFETRVVDGILEVRSESAMVGYLNAPDPFDEDGWMSTGDRVEQDGEYFRILGRESEIINVGGQKVFPAEVETVLLEASNIDDVTVYGEEHRLMGAVVMARVSLHREEDPAALRSRLRKHCLAKLQPYKVPVRFQVTDESQHNLRYKKVRPTARPAKSPQA